MHHDRPGRGFPLLCTFFRAVGEHPQCNEWVTMFGFLNLCLIHPWSVSWKWPMYHGRASLQFGRTTLLSSLSWQPDRHLAQAWCLWTADGTSKYTVWPWPHQPRAWELILWDPDIHPSIHPSIFYRLSAAGSWWQQAKQVQTSPSPAMFSSSSRGRDCWCSNDKIISQIVLLSKFVLYHLNWYYFAHVTTSKNQHESNNMCSMICDILQSCIPDITNWYHYECRL